MKKWQKSIWAVVAVLGSVVTAQATETTVSTSTGAKFTQVDRPFFMGAWRQESTGLIWGNPITEVVNHQVQPAYFVQSSQYMKEQGYWFQGERRYWAPDDRRLGAVEECQRRGGFLPTHEDFVRLREDMGARPGTWVDYSPQVLPGLAQHGAYWTSTVDATDSEGARTFNGEGGDFYYDLRHFHLQVRCVTR